MRTTRVALASLVIVVVAAGVVVGGASPAAAHASLVGSEPAKDSQLETAPDVVTLHFSEPPELSLSTIEVRDPEGRTFARGRPEVVSGSELSLRILVDGIDRGVYTVSWRVVSLVDGHLTAGGFAFGVGEAVDITNAGSPASDKASVPWPGVAGRGLFLGGLAVMGGSAWVLGWAFGPHRRAPLLVGLAWATASIGVVILGAAQLADVGIGLDTYLGSSLGRAWWSRVGGLVVGGVGVVLSQSRYIPRARGLGYVLIAAGSIWAIGAHVGAGHAASRSTAMVAAQVLHVSAIAWWLGGLPGLLIGLREKADTVNFRALRRFSTMAAVGICVVVVTGVVRTVDEVGRWDALVDTTYGRLILAKSALLLVIGALGAINRFRNVPRSASTPGAIRLTSRVEVAVGAAAVGVSALLASSLPPTTAATGPGTPAVVEVVGSDFGTTMTARLTATPGVAGFNQFRVEIADYDTGDPIDALGLALRFALPAAPRFGETTLQLTPDGAGTFVGEGTNLAVPGRWRVTLLVQESSDATELILDVATLAPDVVVSSPTIAGEIVIHDVALGAGRVLQLYAEPGGSDRAQLHLTYFDATGSELPISTLTVGVGIAEGPLAPTSVRRFGPGHFLAEAEVEAGPLRIEASAVSEAGEILFAPFQVQSIGGVGSP